jgi:hypothetical protein
MEQAVILSLRDTVMKVVGTLPKKFRPSRDSSFRIIPGGSDRKFVRISDHDKKMMLMISDPLDKEFTNYLQIHQYLNGKKLGVPEIYHADEACRTILMEDLGDHSVEYLVKGVLKGDDIMKLYKGVVVFLAELQVEGHKGFEACAPVRERKFDEATMRWETNYFREYFLEKFCRIEPARSRKLDKEFEHLARSLVDEPYYFLHRDFQSQNIFIKDGKVRIVDFQSARQGMLAYDLASILKDAYVVLKDDARKQLVDFYLNYLVKIKGVKIEPERFADVFTRAGLQRNMQALGAFAYLSTIKEKQRYIRYVPAGVKYLHDALTADKENRYPRLSEIVKQDVQEFLAGAGVTTPAPGKIAVERS